MEKKLMLKDLPPAVQQTLNAELKGGEIKSIDRETEHGVTQYEIETMVNGKRRDFNVDLKGNMVAVEEETAIDAIPAPAKASILKRVADGKLGLVEIVKQGAETLYEAHYTSKNGKRHEVLVKADGAETKE
jgi:hypothetical protein